MIDLHPYNVMVFFNAIVLVAIDKRNESLIVRKMLKLPIHETKESDQS